MSLCPQTRLSDAVTMRSPSWCQTNTSYSHTCPCALPLEVAHRIFTISKTIMRGPMSIIEVWPQYVPKLPVISTSEYCWAPYKGKNSSSPNNALLWHLDPNKIPFIPKDHRRWKLVKVPSESRFPFYFLHTLLPLMLLTKTPLALLEEKYPCVSMSANSWSEWFHSLHYVYSFLS